MSDQLQLVQDYERDGVVRIRKFFTAETVAEIRAELERYIGEDLSSKPPDARTFEADGKTIRNLWRLEQHSEFFRELGHRTEITDLVAKLV